MLNWITSHFDATEHTCTVNGVSITVYRSTIDNDWHAHAVRTFPSIGDLTYTASVRLYMPMDTVGAAQREALAMFAHGSTCSLPKVA